MSIDEKLTTGIIEDVDVMFDYMLVNKMYDSMSRYLSMIKPTYPEDKWQHYFNLWEEEQHRGKYDKT